MPVYIPGPAVRPASFNIGPWSPEAIGPQIGFYGAWTTFGSATWPSANLAIGYPFMLTEPRKVLQMWVYNGSAVSGNVDAGIYDAAGNKIIAKGSTAQSGTSDLQLLDVTDTWLPTNQLLYAWMALDNTTGTTTRLAGGVSLAQTGGTGVVQMASGFSSGLVATITPAAIASNYIPAFGPVFTSTI